MTDFEPLEDLYFDVLASIQKTVRLIDAAVMDITRLPAAINMMKAYHALMKTKGEAADPSALEAMTETLPLLEEERASGFTFYFGLATIAIWSALEAYVNDLLAKYMEIDDTPLARDPIRKLKVSIGDFNALTAEERRYHIIEALDRELSAPMRTGIGRFESLLEPFGLGGAAGPELRACILELATVRNVLIHRNGLADERLLRSCPWLSATRNQPVLVSGGMMHMYGIAASLYASEVYRRVQVRLGQATTNVDRFIEGIGPLLKRTTCQGGGVELSEKLPSGE